ncbi:MAG: hypothetical protein IPG02_14040 [Ignavibacteria bacterium]|nr:hypothetical protein [Ignavibacteria bacterium]
MEENFFISAECTWEVAADGTPLNSQYISVRVKDSSGEAVTGLKKSDFKVYEMGFGFGNINIALVQEINAEAPTLPILPGTYRIKLTRNLMMKGQFVMAVIVNKMSRGRNKKSLGSGQVLVSVIKIK